LTENDWLAPVAGRPLATDSESGIPLLFVPRFHQPRSRLERTKRIRRMMQQPIRHHQIKGLFLERRAEQVHLREACVSYAASVAKPLRQTKGMQAHIGSKNTPVIVHAEKIGELARATTHFQNQSPLWNLLIQKAAFRAFSIRVSVESMSS
jgi:hypothetical protein